MAAPGINITYNGPNAFYNRLGIQRSIGPDGAEAERDTNKYGVKGSVQNAHTLVIDELGFKRDAAPGTPALWFRAGAIYNAADYKSFVKLEREASNRGLYIAGDYQFAQHEGPVAFRGWYAGPTAHAAPPE